MRQGETRCLNCLPFVLSYSHWLCFRLSYWQCRRLRPPESSSQSRSDRRRFRYTSSRSVLAKALSGPLATGPMTTISATTIGYPEPGCVRHESDTTGPRAIGLTAAADTFFMTATGGHE